MDDLIDMASSFEENANQPQEGAAPDRKDVKARLKSLMDEYTVHDQASPMDGLVNPRKEQALLDDLASICFDTTIDRAQDVDGGQRNRKARNLYHDLAESLGPCVFTWAKTKDENKPSSRPLKYGNDVSEHAFSYGFADFTKNYHRPQPPIPGYKEDTVAFLQALKATFGNVKSPAQTANSIQRVLERIHAKSGTPGATEHQAALYLVTDTTGGTGKTYNLSHGVLPCFQSLGFDAEEVAGFDPQWPSPTIALQHISVLQDVDRLEDISPTYLNALIDGKQTRYNIKFGGTGQVPSLTTLVMASNKFIWDPNDRRWCTVEYLQNSVETLTDKERAQYFPLWGNPEGYKQAWLTMLRSVPFGRQWELPKRTEDDDTIVVPHKYADVLFKLKNYIMDIRPEDTTPWDTLPPSQLATKLLNDENTHFDTYERKSFKKSFHELVKHLHAHKQLKYEGRCDPYYAEQNFVAVIVRLSADVSYDAKDKKGAVENPFEAAAREWDKLIEKEKARQQNKN